MNLPFRELYRYLGWKDRFLKDYERIINSDLSFIHNELKELGVEKINDRLLRAVRSMYVGGMEHRVEDEEIRKWTNWAAVKTYDTFNGFPNLNDTELSFAFYSIGKLFVPLLMHERGVKSEPFKKLSREEQEEVVFDELDTIWETQLTLILQAIQFMDFREVS